jgi:ribokinase
MDVPTVVVVGQIARDLIVLIDQTPGAGEAAGVRSRHEVLGGKGANQAVALTQLGLRAGLVAVVGTDDVGDRVLAQAARDGIDVSHVVRRNADTGLIIEMLEPDGTRRYLEDLPEPVLLTEDDIAVASNVLESASAVLVQLQQPSVAAVAAAQCGKAGGALVVCDGAVADDEWRDALLASSDVVRADARETELLIGMRADDVTRAVEAARDLLAMGPSLVALASDQGNLFVWRDGDLLVPLTDAPVVDTTGAGDALTAALTVALLRGDTPERAAQLAVAAATVTVGHPGGRPRLDQGSLRTHLAQIELLTMPQFREWPWP